MPVSLEDLIEASLETADCEKSNNFSAAEKARIVNETISNTYDFIVATWESYFAKAATFVLDATNQASLAFITSGIPAPPAWPVAAPVFDGNRSIIVPGSLGLPSFALTVAGNNTLQFFAVGGSVSFPVSQGFTPPAGRVLQIQVTPLFNVLGQNTLLTIYRDGLPAFNVPIVLPAGSTSNVMIPTNEIAFGGPVHFNGEQILDLVFQESGTGVTWNMTAQLIYQLDQPETDFYKELGVSQVVGTQSRPIDPLSGFRDRNRCEGPRYWIQGETFSMWPQLAQSHAGTYTIDYVPNCPVLAAGDILPVEVERWRELIEVGAGIKFMAKRRQDTADLKEQLAALKAGVVTAAASRKAEPRKLRVMRDHDQFPGRFGPNRRGW